ncbi:hypothetical protein JOC36_000902 [Weissella uvarum]|uniref:hypothetical protein n=1 Tax=Weissella uvarum TaxID=1479233 RepID=UPI001EF95E7F|nr:hypothetical protein [Weissella uvarum]MBM7617345.1 hypothetical protein [Weissella uvarum]
MWIIDGFRKEQPYKLKACLALVASLAVSAIPVVLMAVVQDPQWLQVVALSGVFIPSIFLVEGGPAFILLVGAFYLLRDKRA